MRYLKTYKKFEASKPLEPGEWSWTKDYALPKEVQWELWDISMELKDLGYSINFEWWPEEIPNPSFRKTKYPNISITKIRPENPDRLQFIKWSNIEDYCERVKSYLISKGYIVKFVFRNITAGYTEVETGSDSIETFQYKIEIIDPKIFTELKESYTLGVDSFEEDKQWVKDSLLDLSDVGCSVNIRTYPVYGVKCPGLSITIESKSGRLIPISVSEHLLTIDSYLRERGFFGFRPYDYDNPYSASRHQVTVNAQLKGVRNQFENELSQFVKMLDRFQVNAPFDSISVNYYKPNDEINESKIVRDAEVKIIVGSSRH